MTEHAIPLDVLEDYEGVKEFAPVIEQKLPRVDAARGIFVTSRGNEIQLSPNPVSALIVERLQAEGKPKIPMIEVLLLGKHKQLEPHVNHEGYQARLKEWQEEAQLKLIRYLFVVGTKGQPPQEFIDEQSPFFPGASEAEMKYLWVASQLPDDDMADFTEAIMGRSLVTAKGLDESADSFRREG